MKNPTWLFIGLASLTLPALASAMDLRPLAADRPDATESPQTVDKGHWQIETSILGYAQDKQDGQTTRIYQALNTNLKYGLTNSVDIHVVFTPYIHQETSNTSEQGHSDLELRTKINLWGNDAGKNAMALLPYIKLATGEFSNDKTEGGLIATYGTGLADYSIGAQLQIDYLYDELKDEMSFVGSYAAVLGYDINHNVAGYIEQIGEFDTEDTYTPYASFGFTYQTNSNRQWDLGSKLALDNKGQDFEVFFGLTQRY